MIDWRERERALAFMGRVEKVPNVMKERLTDGSEAGTGL